MSTVYYPAIMEKAGDDGISVFFPDLPGCTSFGKNQQEAAKNAKEALFGHILVSQEYGDELNKPSEFQDITCDSDVKEISRILVEAKLPGKPVRVNVMIDDIILKAIDNVAKNRSEFLSKAAVKYLTEDY